ncbi:MAG: glutathione S-transferase N-terminal domain-containing protein [Steroidobacteraceae bacterium]|nr:glutathione S-transferase N-terminal domain-containing protein [Steroidobacteraceae bacterium]
MRIVLAAKGLEARIVEVDPARPPEDLIDLNPFQAIPTLVDRDLVAYGAGIITEYLDERFPAPALLPGDPAGRAQARVALHRIEQDWYALVPLLDGGEKRDETRARRLLLEAVLAAEPLFRVKPWFLSDHFSLLDAAVAPILWRLPHWRVTPTAGATPLDRYSQRAFAHPAFRASLSEAERDLRA